MCTAKEARRRSRSRLTRCSNWSSCISTRDTNRRTVPWPWIPRSQTTGKRRSKCGLRITPTRCLPATSALDIQLVRGEISVDGYVNALNEGFSHYVPELQDIFDSGQDIAVLDNEPSELVSRELMLDPGAYQEFRSLT